MFWAKIGSHQKSITPTPRSWCIWYIEVCSVLWICSNKKAYKRTPPFFIFPWYLSNICQKHLFVEERITNISFLSQEQLYLLPLQRIQRCTYRVLQTIQMKLMILCIWAERAILNRAKTALKFKYEI